MTHSKNFINSKLQTFIIDGENFSTLEEFYNEINHKIPINSSWGENLDAFDDILRGGFGTPEEGFILVWKNSTLSQSRLGYKETIRHLTEVLERCHVDNRLSIKQQILDAQNGKGDTIFDTIVDIIKTHGPEGEEYEDNIILYLR